MEARSLCRPGGGLRCFMISGIQDREELLFLHRSINALGGKVADLNQYTEMCSHVIAKEFNSTEKVLGALAGGKWLVNPDYVKQCVQKGCWLEESDYELRNHGEVAKYCRKRKEETGRGIYSGWTIYVFLKDKSMSRSFRRIVAAGDAEVVQLDQISNVDLVISDHNTLPEVRSVVGSVTPVVGINFIKDTLVLKADPSNLQCYLLDESETGWISKKHKTGWNANLKVVKRDDRLQKRPFEDVSRNNKKLCTPVKKISDSSYQQTNLDQFVTCSPRKSASPACQTPTKSNKRRLRHLIYSPDKQQPTITKYCIKEEKSPRQNGRVPLIDLNNSASAKTQCNNKQNEVQKGNICSEMSDDLEIIEDRPNKVVERNDDDCYITEVVGAGTVLPKKWDPTKVLTEKDNEYMRNKIRERCKQAELSRLKAGQEKVEKSIDKDTINSDHRNIILELNSGNKIDSQTEDLHAKGVSNNCKLSNDLKENPAVPKRMALKEVRVNLGKRVECQGLSIKANQTSISIKKEDTKQGLVWKIARDPSLCQLILKKDDLKRGILKFVKKYKFLSSSYDGEQSFILRELTYVLYPPYRAHCSPEIRQLESDDTSMSYFMSSIVYEDDQDFPLQALDFLYLNITPYSYPSDAVLRDLLKKLVLETPFSLVYSRALGVAYQVLKFHPPVSSWMRNYYFRVLNSTMEKSEVTGTYLTWKFMRSAIENLQVCTDSTNDDSSSDEKASFKMEHSLGLLEFLVALFKKDIKHSNSREAVSELLMWRVFWSYSRTPSATMPVKQLIRFWVTMVSSSAAIRQCLTQLVSMVLELAWRSEKKLLIPVSPLPTSLFDIDTELQLRMKDCGHANSINLIVDFTSPWTKMILCSLIFQRVALINNEEIILRNIMDYIVAVHAGKEAVSPTKTSESDKKSHVNREVSLVTPKKKNLRTSTSRKRISPHCINKTNHKGETTLIRACIKNNVERVRELLTVPDIDINMADNLGWTALHEAAMRGFDECVKLLLNHNCYDALGKKNTLLSYMRRDAVSYSVNVSARGGDEGRTPLHDAVESNHLSTVKLLLDHGGVSLLKDKTVNGITPGDLAKTEEMRQLLKSYKRTSQAGKKSGFEKFSKMAVITSGLNNPNGFLPNLDDQMKFILTYVNSYLEVSGTRFLRYGIIKEIEMFCKNKMIDQPHSNILQVNDKRVVDSSGATKTRDLEMCSTDKQENVSRIYDDKLSSARGKSLFCQVTTPSSAERALSDSMFEHFKLNLVTYRDQSTKPAKDDTDFDEALKFIFL
ncbi:LOW QUALITY PROTEIN: SMC5-SMC6 complex localization factor protein 1 [Procambarus clarkii]|uniref:LOW QUALITY PROTEIN: SMC5-SMC6 complex localization factor protein 1 n=1 Tax=Procambarus clarkii TaxID=6728 RepID=UPI003743E055